MATLSRSLSSAAGLTGDEQFQGPYPGVLGWTVNNIVGAPLKLLTYWENHRRIVRTVNQLEGLSDRMLADIGLNRHDIPRVARYGRDETDVRAGLDAKF